MEYIKINNAKEIINKSPYLIKNPQNNKGNWQKVFNNNNPINIELGTGRGDFIIDMAISQPNINFIGIELNESQLVRATEKLEKIKIDNLKLICMDIKDLDKVFQKEINTIYITFPEPWPKAHDESKRITHESYLKIYDKIFKKNKHIILKTDNKNYFAYSLETLSSYWYTFKKVSLDLHNEEKPIKNIMTNYEKQYLKEKRPIYYLDAYYEN